MRKSTPLIIKLMTVILPLLTFNLFAASAAVADVKAEYVRPGVDFTRYTQFIVDPVDVSELALVPPPWVTKPNPRKWELSDESIAFIRSLYTKQITAGLESNGKFNVVKNVNDKTIAVEVKLIRITPWAEKGKKDETLGSGEMKFEAMIRDGQTGDLLALYEGVQNVGKHYQENTPINHEHNFKEHFYNWGKNLADALKKAQK